MNDKKLLSWYKLFKTKNIGPATLHKVYEHLESNGQSIEEADLERFISDTPKLFGRIKGKVNISDDQSATKEIEELNKTGVSIIYRGHERYPDLLRERTRIERSGIPFMLFCKGNTSLLCKMSASIHGSRDASQNAIEISNKIATLLAQQGINVISGYAKGVDTCAHENALKHNGTTTIVLSYGINHFKAKRCFDGLISDSNTLIVSQFDPDSQWTSSNAMIRNKLICALAQSVVVIEAGAHQDNKKSGSLHAGEVALKMGKPLYVIDPSCFNKEPEGNKILIEKGGIKVNTAELIHKLSCFNSPELKDDQRLVQKTIFSDMK